MRCNVEKWEAAKMIYLFRLLTPFAILAGLVLGFVLYAWTLAEFEVKAQTIIIAQKSEEAEIAVELMERKGLLGRPKPKCVKWKANKCRRWG